MTGRHGAPVYRPTYQEWDELMAYWRRLQGVDPLGPGETLQMVRLPEFYRLLPAGTTLLLERPRPIVSWAVH